MGAAFLAQVSFGCKEAGLNVLSMMLGKWFLNFCLGRSGESVLSQVFADHEVSMVGRLVLKISGKSIQERL